MIVEEEDCICYNVIMKCSVIKKYIFIEQNGGHGGLR